MNIALGTRFKVVSGYESGSKAMAAAEGGEVHPYYSYTVAPEVPKDRVEALRKALLDTFNDPQFKSDAEKAGIVVSPTPGEEVGRIYKELLNTSPTVLAKLKEVLK